MFLGSNHDDTLKNADIKTHLSGKLSESTEIS
jgi:hypothetical protein